MTAALSWHSPVHGAALLASAFLAACSGARGGETHGGESGHARAAAGGPPATRCALPPQPKRSPFALRYDQVGYEPGTAWAVVLGAGQAAPRYRVVDASGCPVLDGVAGPRVLAATSRAGTPLTGDRIELSGLRTPGSYTIILDDGSRAPVRIARAPYAAALEPLVSFLRVQRCGRTTAELSHHGACHLHGSLTDADPASHSGDGVAVDDGFTGDVTAATGPAVDAEGGWHDAGDHIKFVGTAAFTLAVDLAALRDRGPALERVAGAATVAALRTELRWGLDWLAKMVAGPVYYHQVSGQRDHVFGFRDPARDTARPAQGYAHRPVIRLGPGRGANLLGRAAAALATGALVFADDRPYAARLIATARRAYAEAARRPAAQSPNPSNFYGEGSTRDDLALGAAALARATGERTYRDAALAHARALTPDAGAALYWGGVDSLALVETALLFPDDSPERAELAAALTRLAAPIAASATAPRGAGAAFGYALPRFGNGTIEESLGAASVCLAARRIAPAAADACLQVARDQLHWLWGANPFGVSFQIGLGTRNPAHPHHSLAATTGLVLAGAIVGGPTSIDVLDGNVPLPPPTDTYARWSTDALVYADDVESWVVNEPAIDFTAPLVYVVAELAAQAENPQP
jgi:endoglucanase